MKLTSLHTFLALVFLVLSLNLNAKTPEQSVIDTGTVKQQWEHVLKKSTTYQQYKVIKIASVNKLKNNVLDSLEKSNQIIVSANNLSAERQASIDSLSLQLNATKDKLLQTINEKNSVSLLGFAISKSAYNTTMWSMVFILALSLIVLLLMYKRSHVITKKVKYDFEELKEGFDNYRLRAREKEERMARKHLDEVLKYKENQHRQFSPK